MAINCVGGTKRAHLLFDRSCTVALEMAREVALSYADIEREAAELRAGFTTMEGRNSFAALSSLSARRDWEESRRGNSTPSSASSERVRSPDSDGVGQGAFFSPPFSASVDQRGLTMEQVQRMNAERLASEVRSRHNGRVPHAVQGGIDRETKKVLKKLADKWSRYADSFGACKHSRRVHSLDGARLCMLAYVHYGHTLILPV